MTHEQRDELEVYLDILDSIIAGFTRLSVKNNIQLFVGNEFSIYFKNLINIKRNLRKTNNYQDVVDPNIPIKTCNLLNKQGYETNLVVIACDAEESWQSTISRAKLMKEMGYKPRLVPIDKYNVIVRRIVDSLSVIEKERCFSSINVVNRSNEIIYKSSDDAKASECLQKVLNLENWDKNFPAYAKEYIEEKINIIKKEQEEIGK